MTELVIFGLEFENAIVMLEINAHEFVTLQTFGLKFVLLPRFARKCKF